MTEQTINSAPADFTALREARVALLTTFRRNGAPVATPVGIRLAGEKVHFTTWTTTAKVKRIANNPRVTLAPCTRAGKPTGPAAPGIARRLAGAEADRALAEIRDSWFGRLWLLIYRLRGYEPAFYEVVPAQ